jgi:glycosyltransferase involved in cell wall biosynthesis
MGKIQVTVLIPAYNAAGTINRAIDSILNQKYNQELIKIVVVNDGSKDETLSILLNYQKIYGTNKIKIITQVNKGLSATRNILINHVETN